MQPECPDSKIQATKATEAQNKAGQRKSSVIASGSTADFISFCSETTELVTVTLNIILKTNAASVDHTFRNVSACQYCGTTVGPSSKQQAEMKALELLQCVHA